MNDEHVIAHAPLARDLVDAVHARDPEKVHDVCARLDHAALTTTAILLAEIVGKEAAVVLDRLVGRDEHGVPAQREAWTADELRVAHAAFNRREMDPWTIAGEREYQRRRNQRRRRLVAANEAALKVRGGVA